MRTTIVLSLLLAVTVPALAQTSPVPPGTRDKSRIVSGTYNVDPLHAQVLFEVNHLGFNNYFGIFGDITGTLQIDPANLAAAKVEVTIPLSSLATNSTALTKHMMEPEFFDAGKFPTATFKSTRVVIGKDGETAKIMGDLTVKGVTKPVVLQAWFGGAGITRNPPRTGARQKTIGFSAHTLIKRSDFNMAYGVPLVSDEVSLKISVAFENPAD